MRVTQFRGYVKLEVRIKIDFLVPEFDDNPVPLLDQGFVKDGAQGGIQFFLHILKQYRITKLYGVLQSS